MENEFLGFVIFNLKAEVKTCEAKRNGIAKRQSFQRR